jgi:exodeoxyribonuclease V alpha subunit
MAAQGLDPIRDVQVLVPVKRGELGLETFNPLIQCHLVGGGGHAPATRYGSQWFHVGDKVVNTYNDYERNVMNGDIGIVKAAAPVVPQVSVEFDDGRSITYTDSEIARLEPAFALTVHKFQGSECPGVIIPVWWYGEMMHRSMLYTAMTRAQKLAVLIGPAKAITAAVRLDLRNRRETGLRAVLNAPLDETLRWTPLSRQIFDLI